MNAILGYVRGNAIVAEQNLQNFDGCKVRIEIMDKKTLELENLFGVWKDRGDGTSPDETVRHFRNKVEVKPKNPKRSFGMAKGELRYPDDIDFCNDEIAAMFGGGRFQAERIE